MALVNWTISNVIRRGIIPLTTPEIVRSSVAEKCGFQPRGENTQVCSIEGSDQCLIGTAEIPVGGIHMDSSVAESSLPLKYLALSHCFRTEAGAAGTATRSRTSPIFASTVVALRGLLKLRSVERSYLSISYENQFIITTRSRGLSRRFYHDGRPRGSLWRGKKLIGKEALFVILGLKRVKDDEDNLNKFIKTHVFRLLKMDVIAVLVELERQDQVTLALKVFMVIQKEDWYKPDAFLYKDLIVALAKSGKMDDVMQLWESMKKENLFPDSQTYTEVIRGFLKCGSPEDAMNIYEDMKKSPDPPEELPFRTLLKGLLPHPLLRNKVKQEFEEIFPDSRMYDPPEEIFGLR